MEASSSGDASVRCVHGGLAFLFERILRGVPDSLRRRGGGRCQATVRFANCGIWMTVQDVESA